MGISTFYFMFLFIDIRLHIKKSKLALKAREERQAIFDEQIAKTAAHFQMGNGLEMAESGNIHLSIPMPTMNVPPVKAVSHRYCFATGRHGEFLYLKFGAAWFCFGLLIHSILVIAYQITYFNSDDPDYYNCASVITLVFDILFPLYSLFILFFIFKYANVIINEFRGIARFALMHAIGTSLAFWIFTIVRETVDAIRLKEHMKNEANGYHSNSSQFEEKLPGEYGALDQFRNEKCLSYGLNSVYRTLSPYLYPFIIEFCILIGKFLFFKFFFSN